MADKQDITNSPNAHNYMKRVREDAENNLSYKTFREKMLKNGKIYWVENPLNAKESKTSSIYRENEKTGLELYLECYSDAQDILDEYEVRTISAREFMYNRFVNERRIPDKLNNNCDLLIATPKGEVIDLEALYNAIDRGEDPQKAIHEWKRPISQYKDRFLTLRTGVNYPMTANLEKGKTAMERFFRLVFSSKSEELFQDAFQWILQYFGRMLIGKNIWKEFVIFAGEKDSGKTTIARFLERIFGSYAAVIPDEAICGKDSVELHRLLYTVKDKRLLIHSEGSSKRKINTQTLKRITGDSSITLDNKGIHFSVHGKLIEDTNYIPKPDNENDEAFNDRLIIIPFFRNEWKAALSKAIIQGLYDEIENIFALMVHEAVKSMGEAPKTRPNISATVKHDLAIVRDPIKFFYQNYCEMSYEDSSIPAKDLLRIYREWIVSIAKDGVLDAPYLKSEPPINMPTDESFNARMRNLHPYSTPRSNVGYLYTHIRVAEEKIYWKHDVLSYKKDPRQQMKLDYINQLDDMENKARTVNLPDRYNNALNEQIAKKEQRFQTSMRQPSSGTLETVAYMNVGFDPYYMERAYFAFCQFQFQEKMRRMNFEYQMKLISESLKRSPPAIEPPPAKDTTEEEPYQVRELPPDYFAPRKGIKMTPFDYYPNPLNNMPAKKSIEHYVLPFDLYPDYEYEIVSDTNTGSQKEEIEADE